MKSLWSKFVMLVGYLTIVCTVYTASFYLVRETLILPHERSSGVKPHGVRPVYNSLFKPLRWFEANGRSLRPKPEKVYFGTITELTKKYETEAGYRAIGIRTAESQFLDLPPAEVRLGFVGDQDVIEKVDALMLGGYVRLNLRSVLASDSDRFINKLMRLEEIELMPNPWVEYQQYSAEQQEAITATFEALEDDARHCLRVALDEYREQVFAHCQQAGYGRSVGGGCHHMVGQSVHTAVLEKAMKTCGAESSNSVGQVSETSKTSG